MDDPFSGMDNSTMCCVGVVALAIIIAMLWATYSLAESHNKNGCVWMVIVFIFGIWGFAIFIIYILVTGSQEKRARDQYGGRPGTYGGRPPTTGYGGPSQPYGAPQQMKVEADTGFRDYELDDLIENGQLSEARKYLTDMLKMAKEMGDDKGYANYKQYEKRITAAASDPTRRRRQDGEP